MIATGTPANAIAYTEALLPDGSMVTYSDLEPRHVRERRFDFIMQSNPVRFDVVTTDGYRFSVDLVTGEFSVGGQAFTPSRLPTTPLRLIYYKRMAMDAGQAGGGTFCEHFVIGWQTTETVGGELRNTKVGIRVNPTTHELTPSDDI